KTFREAVELAKRLGLEFLWIDSLCIFQGSVNDWRLKSSRIGDVYRYGTINIAATGAASGLDGLFFERKTHIIEPLFVKPTWNKLKPDLLWNNSQKPDFP